MRRFVSSLALFAVCSLPAAHAEALVDLGDGIVQARKLPTIPAVDVPPPPELPALKVPGAPSAQPAPPRIPAPPVPSGSALTLPKAGPTLPSPEAPDLNAPALPALPQPPAVALEPPTIPSMPSLGGQGSVLPHASPWTPASGNPGPLAPAPTGGRSGTADPGEPPWIEATAWTPLGAEPSPGFLSRGASPAPGAQGADLVASAALATTVLAAAALGRLGAIALYHRIARHRTLEQATRRTIYETIAAEPGIRVGTIHARLGLNHNTVLRHVRILEDHGMVVAQGQGQRRWFAAGAAPRPEEKAAAVIASGRVASRVLAYLKTGGGADLQALRRDLLLPRSTASAVVARLARADLVLVEREGPRLRVRAALPAAA